MIPIQWLSDVAVVTQTLRTMWEKQSCVIWWWEYSLRNVSLGDFVNKGAYMDKDNITWQYNPKEIISYVVYPSSQKHPYTVHDCI